MATKDESKDQAAEQRQATPERATDARATQATARAQRRDESATELPDGGSIVESKGVAQSTVAAVADNAQADTDLVDRTVRSQREAVKALEGGDADPREVVDKDHVEVAGGEVVVQNPNEPAPGTLLPKDPGAPPQGTHPGMHVPAPQRRSASGAPLN